MESVQAILQDIRQLVYTLAEVVEGLHVLVSLKQLHADLVQCHS